VIGWALRQARIWVVLALLCVAALHRLTAYIATLQPPITAVPGSAAYIPRHDTLVFPADTSGHVFVDAEINGAPVRLLLDTGATLLTLSLADAHAAGIDRGELAFVRRVVTANGIARMAPVTLREVRIEQLSLADVPAAVLENLNISLLGMSLLQRLPSYQLRDGKLVIGW
jgi:aspartyl protease family protein